MVNTALAVSLGFMGTCCASAIVARRIASRAIKTGLAQELVYEAIAAAELCACCFELCISELKCHLKSL